MGKIFNSIGHFFAWILHTALPAASTVVSDAEKLAASPLAASLASAVAGPGAAAALATMAAISGQVLAAINDAGGVIAAEGLNVKFDQAIVADVEALYKSVAGLFRYPSAPPQNTGTK